ncbi:MAG: EamA family transporter [Candidatus Kerfeldbacteria bacterium]|nr:EamA family transporter [Candidatus Kerfeldbacteria bacterium]
MSGFVFVILGSILFPIIEAIKKRATQSIPVPIIFWAIATFTAPVYIGYLCWTGIPSLGPNFWLLIGINTPLLILSNLMLIKDEKIAPLSTTLPLLSFTPVFLIFTSFFLLGELPNSYGVIGIFLVVLGAILLKGEELRRGLFYRMRDIFTHRSSLYILAIAFMYSFSATFAKLAIQESNVWFFLGITVVTEAIFMNVWMLSKRRKDIGKFFHNEHAKLLGTVALLAIAADVFIFVGMETTLVSYVIAIKRAFLISGSILLGAAFFHERNIKYRIGGALITIIGLLFILVFGSR